MVGTCWYRLEDYRAANWDPYSDYSTGSTLYVIVRQYKVVKQTPKGVRLATGLGDTRMVLHSSKKQFACPSIEAAIESYKARKHRQASIYQSRLADIEQALNLVASGNVTNLPADMKRNLQSLTPLL